MKRTVAMLAAAAITAGAVAVIDGEQAPPLPTPAPVVVPSQRSHISLIEGPRVDGQEHAGLREESGKLSGLGPVSIPKNPPLASPTQRGCATKLVRNHSSRGGIAPQMFVLHYTVSANRAGLSDVDAIRNWFNSSRSQASSHYIIDFEGNCYLIVAESDKAWTQGSFNPASISVEFIATGREATGAWGERGLRKGARVAADALKRWDIPLRLVNPSGCTVTAGITDHNRLECGNTHTDVRPNFPYAKFMRYVREAAGSAKVRFELRAGGSRFARSSAVTAGRRSEARKLRVFLGDESGTMTRKLRRGDSVRIGRVSGAVTTGSVRLVRLISGAVRFELRSDGEVVSTSTGVAAGYTREHRKLDLFLGNVNADLVDALRTA